MNLISTPHKLSGHITVPGSKSHTIRALVLASLADGESIIRNPLASNDCLSAAKAIQLIGASVDFGEENTPRAELPKAELHKSELPKKDFGDVWRVNACSKNRHLPDNIIDVENSGSTMYFFAPVCSTFKGSTVFTGDSSIRKRPVLHLLDALSQLGAAAFTTRPERNAPPFVITGPIKPGSVTTGGELSQYISGLMMACSQLDGTTKIELTNPKEVPYLSMTKWWLNSVGVQVKMSQDFKHIEVSGPQIIQSFDKTIPSDWEGVAFPIIAALISKSDIIIDNIDSSGTQGDEKIVEILQSVGAKIEYETCISPDGNSEATVLHVFGSQSVLSCENLLKGELHIKLADFPDAICAFAVIACFIDGKTILEDIGICRQKETDRIRVMESELKKLGADIKDEGDVLVICGTSEGKNLHGGKVESYDDHRVAMSLSCMGLGLADGEKVEVTEAQCCSVSFPGYVEKMNALGCGFQTIR